MSALTILFWATPLCAAALGALAAPLPAAAAAPAVAAAPAAGSGVQLRVDPVLVTIPDTYVQAVRARATGLAPRSRVTLVLQTTAAQYETPGRAALAGDVGIDLALGGYVGSRSAPPLVALIKDGRTLASARLPESGEAGPGLMLLLGPRSDQLSFLATARSEGIGYAVKAVSGVELPHAWYGYGPVNVVVADVDSLDELDVYQTRALLDWLTAGGVLVSYPGVGGVAPLDGDLAPLAPLSTQAPSPRVEDLSALARAVSSDTTLAPQEVWPSAAAADAEAVGATGTPALGMSRVGLGVWAALAVDPTADGLADSPDRAQFWSWLLLKASPGIPGAGPAYSRPAWGEPSPPGHLPSGWALAFVGLVYVASVGPLNFFLLRRFDRRDLAWVTIPAISAAFTLVMFGLGAAARGGPLESFQAEIVGWGRGADRGVGRLSMSVFSPRTARYDVALSGDWVPVAGGGGLDVLGRPLFRARFGSGGVALRDILVPRWSTRRFTATGIVRRPAPLQFELGSRGQEWSGQVRNVSSSTVDVWLWLGDSGGFVPLGTLAPNQTRSVRASRREAKPVQPAGGAWERQAVAGLLTRGSLSDMVGGAPALVAVPRAAPAPGRVRGSVDRLAAVWVMPLVRKFAAAPRLTSYHQPLVSPKAPASLEGTGR